MILEGVVTTLNIDGSLNTSPMGPEVDLDMTSITLKPFSTSRTYANLMRTREGVLHVTDDVELLAGTAIGRDLQPATRNASVVTGKVLLDACRSYEFQIVSIDDSSERVVMQAKIVHKSFHREFFGFNRAKHAVLEAAILATRLDFLPQELIMEQLERLTSPVEKTAGEQELRAFEMLQEFIADHYRAPGTIEPPK